MNSVLKCYGKLNIILRCVLPARVCMSQNLRILVCFYFQENIYRLTNETYSSTLKQIADNENDRNLNICSRVLGTDKDEYIAAFGFTVAARLKKMSAIQRIYAENLINRILFQGQLKKLRETTTIDQTESSYEFVTVNYSSAT